MTYLLPVRIGLVTCNVTIRRLGGRVGYCEVTLHQDTAGSNKAACLATASLTLLLARGKSHEVGAPVNGYKLQPPPPPLPIADAAARMTAEDRAVLAQGASGMSTPLATFFNYDHVAIDLTRGILWTTYAISPDAVDDNGNVQAGFVNAMLDSGMAYLFMAFRRWTNFFAPTIEMEVHYFADVLPASAQQTTTVVTRFVHISDKFAYLEAELYQDDGVLRVKGESTILVTKPYTPRKKVKQPQPAKL